MSDYIRREDVNRLFEKYHPYMATRVCEYSNELKALPSADVEPVKRGKWLRMSKCSEVVDDRYKCSKCGYVVHQKDRIYLMTYNRWCGHCGSRNDEVGNE